MIDHCRFICCIVISALLPVLTADQADAAVVHDESILADGDLSWMADAPTQIVFAPGLNTVKGTLEPFDRFGFSNVEAVDIFTFDVPTGYVWQGLTIDSYTNSLDLTSFDRSFLAIEDNSTFPYSVFELNNELGPTPDQYLGGYLIGGADIFDPLDPQTSGEYTLNQKLGVPRPGFIDFRGFTGPLPEGSYTVYLQQTDSETNYSLTFNLVTAIPEPSSAGLLLLCSAGLMLRRRR